MKKILFFSIFSLAVFAGGLTSIPTHAALINFSKIDKEAPSDGKKLDAKKMDENKIKVRRLDENQIKVKRLDEDQLKMKH